MKTQIHSWMERCMRATAPFAGALTLAMVVPAFAHEHVGAAEPMAPAGAQVNAEGRLQPDPKPWTFSAAPAMDAARPAAAQPVHGQLKLMNAAVAAPRTGTFQEPVNSLQARAPAKGSGPQLGRRIEAPASTHLHLVLRVTEAGTAEVVSATELPGSPPAPAESTGEYVYEVSSGGQTLAVGSMIDPFETRSFPSKESGRPQVHMIGRAAEATVVAQVPDMNLGSAALRDMTFTLFKVKEGYQLSRLDAAALRDLKQQGKLERRIEGSVGNQVMAKGRKQP